MEKYVGKKVDFKMHLKLYIYLAETLLEAVPESKSNTSESVIT